MNRAFLFIIGIFCVYTIIPTLVVRLFGIGVYKKGTAGRGIALTFDDGPDPQYTPLLLDLLKQHKIRATFFVLGSKAEKYPKLIARMHEEGHLVGLHNYVHWANALMTPQKVRLQLNHSVNVIESIIGEKPVYYRPPWGIINVFDFLLMKRFRVILWSIIVGDWRSYGGKRRIKRKLLSKLGDGAIIVLHDSGQTLGANHDAPTFMLEALHEFIVKTLSKGYSFLRVDERMSLDERFDYVKLSMKKRIFVYLWFKWDKLFHVLFGVKPVDPENPLLFYRVRPYHGKTILLSDGEKIVSGDRVIELHFNNEMLFRMAIGSHSIVHLAVQIIRSVKEVLPHTVKISNDVHYSNIKAIYGITMIHRGANQLGFTLTNLPRGWFSYVTSLYLKVLLYTIHPKGKTRLKVKSDALTPKVLAISIQELKKRHLNGLMKT
ncbi:polysaccharide deacetylase family protein [Paenibacillus agricola]|uniref:Polysaccharide deacetylase family protein n=1 Tax=Paenibacillus agricola TaxID=2716264 RepID=A0ABX0JI37_9BACL|nr:polysaccharide deacetylase family protein [Paenibacillus agricola]NHN35014.1 polysaccharide deacetylase family protein [Paenibacillus agricola]